MQFEVKRTVKTLMVRASLEPWMFSMTHGLRRRSNTPSSLNYWTKGYVML